MTQIEFENQLRELRCQKAQVMNQFQLMQNEVKEEIAAKNRMIHELSEQVQRLHQQRAAIAERRLKAEKDWGGKFRTLSTRTWSRSTVRGTLLARTPLSRSCADAVGRAPSSTTTPTWPRSTKTG